ncbi:MAG: hypothetical protein AAGA56_07300, partial [Myxococcota bacterium]
RRPSQGLRVSHLELLVLSRSHETPPAPPPLAERIANALLAPGRVAVQWPNGPVAQLEQVDERDREQIEQRWCRDGYRELRRPSGLEEWQWRSEFVSLRITDRQLKKRLGRMLRKGKGRFGFHRALALHPDVQRAFRDYRRLQLIEFAERWLAEQAER